MSVIDVHAYCTLFCGSYLLLQAVETDRLKFRTIPAFVVRITSNLKVIIEVFNILN